MNVIEKLHRLYKIASYNRDWLKFIPLFANKDASRTERFRLRNGQVLEVPRDARFILNEIYLDRVYDVPTIKFAQLRHVLDLGANVGLFATYIASQNPKATIYCFEPAASNYQDLCINVQRNNVNARLFQSAVSLQDSKGYLSHRGTSVEYALVDESEGSTEEVMCVPFDKVFSLCGVDRFDLLKVDIEGHEKSLFEAASDDFLRKFDHLIVEWHYSLDELEVLADRLRGVGFNAKTFVIEGHMRFLYASKL